MPDQCDITCTYVYNIDIKHEIRAMLFCNDVLMIHVLLVTSHIYIYIYIAYEHDHDDPCSLK